MNTDNHTIQAGQSWRLGLVLSVLAIAVVLICAKVVWLSVQEQAFLQKQGDARSLRVVEDVAQRGIITDRFGKPLAVSAPVQTIWADPRIVNEKSPQLEQLAKLLGLDAKTLQHKIASKKKKHFLYIKRQIEPDLAQQVMALGITGVFAKQEYKRFYPAADMVSQLIGFTGVDGEGQEGLEHTFNEHMRAESGKQLIVKDREGHKVRYIRTEAAAKPGHPLQLTINSEIQYLAYRELKSAVKAHNADSASLVMLDPHNGDILAMVNYPSFNPNNINERVSAAIRNRAAADTFEPGSTMKPLTVAAALMSGLYQPNAVIDTAPGKLKVQGNVISDHRNYGKLDITGIITKSSNVGTAKLALSLEPGALHNMLYNVGLGRPTGVGLLSEQAGRLPFLSDGQRIQRAAMSYGYGL
ncbi:MAG: peptidoglycan D,D-transpeptidase FtsI family protein, partial [Pontibacterium sp.]